MKLDIKIINGRFTIYAEVRSPQGYCFYDVDEELHYANYIATPITDEEELYRKFVLVEGDADVLNEELAKTVEEIGKNAWQKVKQGVQ